MANYGDRLFPLIARDQLASRLPNLELVCHAPLGHADLPPGSPPLFPLVPGGGPLDGERREYFARHFDAVLIGGGDLLRFDSSEPGYENRTGDAPTRPYAAFLDFLWGEDRPTILWNAPGVTFPFESSRRPLVRRALTNVSYAAVRDEVSRGYLLEAGVEGPVEVVPDSGVLLAETIRNRVDERKVRALLGPSAASNGRLCFQCSPGFLRAEEERVADVLGRTAERRNLEVVLLPVGWCHGDLEALRAVQKAGGGRFTLLEDVGSPLEVGAVIGACDYFVGSSLHGNLTALSFGIPHVVVNNPLRAAKLEGYVQLAGLEDFRITDWEDLEACVDRLAATPRERWNEVGGRLKGRASEHFDRLADLISRAAESRGEGPKKPPRPVDREDGSLELYATLGALHERLEDEMAAVLRDVVNLKDLLTDRQQAQNARVERLTERAGRAEDEVRKLRAHKESLEKRLRDIESSATWRLFGAYRWLRPVVGALIRPRSENTRGKGSAGSR